MFIRYIYVYRWSSSAVAVYVGSAWDPVKRDRQHTNSNEIPFARFISKHGREKFMMEIIEAVSSETYTGAMRAAVPRENFWMDELKTWHEFGGQNFARAAVEFSDEEKREAWVAANQAAQRRPEVKAKNAAGVLSALARPEVKARCKAGARNRWDRPEARKQHSEIMRAAMATPEAKTACSIAAKAVWNKRRVDSAPYIKASQRSLDRSSTLRASTKSRAIG